MVFCWLVWYGSYTRYPVVLVGNFHLGTIPFGGCWVFGYVPFLGYLEKSFDSIGGYYHRHCMVIFLSLCRTWAFHFLNCSVMLWSSFLGRTMCSFIFSSLSQRVSMVYIATRIPSLWIQSRSRFVGPLLSCWVDVRWFSLRFDSAVLNSDWNAA